MGAQATKEGSKACRQSHNPPRRGQDAAAQRLLTVIVVQQLAASLLFAVIIKAEHVVTVIEQVKESIVCGRGGGEGGNEDRVQKHTLKETVASQLGCLHGSWVPGGYAGYGYGTALHFRLLS
jgi:hypothetical protein